MSYNLNKRVFNKSSNSKKKVIKFVESTHIKVYNTIDNIPYVNQNESFYEAIAPVIATAQLFCTLPIYGIFSKDHTKILFKWLSARTIANLIFMLFTLIEIILSLKLIGQMGMDFRNGELLSFCIFCLVEATLFFLLSRKWSGLISFWYKKEQVFLNYPYEIDGWSLKTKIKVGAFTILFGALLEHLLSKVSNLYTNQMQILECDFHKLEFWRRYFSRRRPQIFVVVHYHPAMIPLIEWVWITMTFVWSFIDAFIFSISIGLTTRFNQINKRLQSAYGKEMSDAYWCEIRTDYNKLTELLKFVDKELSSIILLSCSSNFIFVCIHMYHSFEAKNSIQSLYFWFSISFLIIKTVCVLLTAATINEASYKPIQILRKVPSHAWTEEVQRFTEQVVHDSNSLSGKSFFFLTRKTVLAMAGTIITYELVMMDKLKEDPEQVNICNITIYNFL